jgi:hypothetical protein
MTQDEIIEMARQAGAVYSNDHAASLLDDEIIIFAKLVAQHEREACAKFFDDNDTNMFWGSQAASHIRERGQE